MKIILLPVLKAEEFTFMMETKNVLKSLLILMTRKQYFVRYNIKYLMRIYIF